MSSYLLSPITSPMGGLGSPSTRLVLLGSRGPHHSVNFHTDSDSFILSEIAEFAMSLQLLPKDRSFHGLPHLQAYRLIRAFSLAEVGHIDIAKRFVLSWNPISCAKRFLKDIVEAITGSFSRSSPYFTAALMEQLEDS